MSPRPSDNVALSLPQNDCSILATPRLYFFLGMGARQRNPLHRALEVLHVMVASTGRQWGVREIARAVGMPPSTTHRILALMKSEGLVAADPQTGGYELGPQFHRLAVLATPHNPLREIAMPVMTALVDRCNETALLGLYEPIRREMMFVASVESEHPLRYVIGLNEWIPIHAGASGLAILAFLPENERREILDQVSWQQPFTPATLTDPKRLEDEIQKIQRQGYALTIGQRIDGIVGIAAPIRDARSRVIGDLTIAMPESRFSVHLEPHLAELVISYSGQISRQLGWHRDEKPVG